jgi:hypothetical protein
MEWKGELDPVVVGEIPEDQMDEMRTDGMACILCRECVE